MPAIAKCPLDNMQGVIAMPELSFTCHVWICLGEDTIHMLCNQLSHNKKITVAKFLFQKVRTKRDQVSQYNISVPDSVPNKDIVEGLISMLVEYSAY